LEVERERIRKALAETNGSVTHAAQLLGITYPGLIYIIQRRHPDLLNERAPVRHRKRRK
jgi:transcriptional regulator with GAF, ATPase, and Fis domain